ncbi:MAG: beta-galactosidase trimerization domain-containing protein [Candidatus Bathyarchaeia archaeon]
MDEKPWWRKPLTIADLSISGADEVLAADPAKIADVKKSLGFNAEHLTCSDIYGGEKGIFYFKTRIARNVPRDFFSEYLPEAHKRGIKVLAYYNVHWINVEFGKEHPEWLQVDVEGRIISDLYGSGNAPCVNSPWREWSLQGIRDLASYDIDGIFLDGPIFAPRACYCESCREKFKRKYGLDLPREEDWGKTVWRDFIEFRYDSIAEYLRDAERTLKEIKPKAIIYMNSTGLWPGWTAARDNRRLIRYQDILGAEGGFLYYDLRRAPLWKAGMTAKLLETQAEGKPTVVFIAGANKGWDEYLLTPTETKLLYADSIANGANPWYGIPWYLSDKPGALAAGEMNRFIIENSEYLEETIPVANVALFWSSKSADFYRPEAPAMDFTPQREESVKREPAGSFYEGFLGCYEILVRSHIPFNVLDEDAIRPEVLRNYDLLVAPNCACLSKDKAEIIKKYVENGGCLIASFETSRYDEYGDLLEEFELADVFGVNVGRGVFGPLNIDYMSVVSDHPIADGLSARLLPCPTYGIEVSPTTSKAICMYHEKMAARYMRLPQLSKNPAILVNEYGRGRCLYIAGNFFEHYYNYHNPDYRRIIHNSVRWMAKTLVTLENCPSSVEVTLRYQPKKDRLIVHLVNFTGEMTRPIESPIALKDIKVALHGFRKYRSAKALRLNQSLNLEESNDTLNFTIPFIQEYEAIVLE